MHRALRLLAAGLVDSRRRHRPRHGRRAARLNQPIALDRPDQSLFNEAVLIYSNAVRRQHGRAALRPDPGLSRAAVDHARNMARLRTHSHVLPVRGQKDLSQRMHRQSLEFRKAAENIAMDKVYRLLGRPISMAHQGAASPTATPRSRCRSTPTPASPQEVVARWLASPKHRASLLSSSFQRLGAGVGRRSERPGLRRLLPGAELRRLVGGRDLRAGAVEQVVPDRRGAGHPMRPAGADRPGVKIGRPVGEGARPAREHQRGELLGARARPARSSSRPSSRRRHRRTGSRVPSPRPAG